MSAVATPVPVSAPVPPDSPLGKLFSHHRRLKVQVASLDEGNDLFEEIEPSAGVFGAPPIRMFRPVALKTEDEVRLFNENLVQYVWHWKDYIQNLAVQDRGLSPAQAKKYLEKQVRQSRSLQLCGYLANLIKHGQVTRFPYFNKEQPQLVEAMVQYPDGMGTYSMVPITNTTDRALSHPGPGVQTLMIWDKEKKIILGHTRFIVDEAAQVWLGVLQHWGIKP